MWGDLVSKPRPLIDPTKPFAERKSNITEWTRSIEKVRVSMPTVADDIDDWKAVLEGFENDLSEMAHADRASAKAMVDEIANKLRFQTGEAHRRQMALELCARGGLRGVEEACWEELQPFEPRCEGARHGSECLVYGQDICVAVHSFYGSELGQQYTEEIDNFMKRVCVLYTSGCLLGGLDKTTSDLDARKIALKQQRRMNKFNLNFEDLVPDALKEKAKAALNFMV